MSDESSNADLASVVRAVAAAFADVTLGDGVTLSQARAIDDYEPEDVRQAARSLDPERRWQDIPDEKLRDMNDVHVFLDPAGYRFYLPAFLVWVLRHLHDERDDHSGLNWPTIFSLDPGHGTARFGALSESQHQAVCRFLRYLVRRSEHGWRPEAEAYLGAYWGQFCPADDSRGPESFRRVRLLGGPRSP